jgi:hypothetical protein
VFHDDLRLEVEQEQKPGGGRHLGAEGRSVKTCVVLSARLDGVHGPAKHHEWRGRVSGGEMGNAWKERAERCSPFLGEPKN